MQSFAKVRIVILAAGKGTRMKSDPAKNGASLPKALVLLRGKPMIRYVLETVGTISSQKPIVVIGHQADLVKTQLANSCEYVLQAEQLGTAHALACAEIKARGAEEIVVLSSDQPLVKKETILHCLAEHKKTGAKITLATTEVQDFESWQKYFSTHGRILRKNSKITGIREYKNAGEEERKIKEVNTGCCYVFESAWLWENLKKINNDNAQKEYLLTDLIEIAHKQNAGVLALKISPVEALGANSQEELEILEKLMVE